MKTETMLRVIKEAAAGGVDAYGLALAVKQAAEAEHAALAEGAGNADLAAAIRGEPPPPPPEV